MHEHASVGIKRIFSTYLVLAGVEVVHVNERDRIPVLMIVQEDADLVERELNVELRRLLV